LPPDWQEGQRLRVEKADETEASIDEIDRDFALLASMCQESDPADEEELDCALNEARRLAKEQVRRDMRLP
jgi:hypothetical protein